MLRQNMVVMDVLGLHGKRFPHGLSATGREVNCLDDSSDDKSTTGEVSDELKVAIPLVLEAGKAEETCSYSTPSSSSIHRFRKDRNEAPPSNLSGLLMICKCQGQESINEAYIYSQSRSFYRLRESS